VLIEILSWTPLKLAAPAPILILAVVCATFVGGLVDGLIAAGITVWYYAYNPSSTGTTFPYTHETLRRVLVFACSAPAVALLVGLLKQRAARSTAEAGRKERESADAVYTSLTWTREAERFGREAERRFRAFFDTSVVGVMHTLRERRLVECNQTLVELLGCDTRQELMTMEADRLFEDPTDYAGLMAEVDHGSARAERDIALWRRSGKPLWVRVFVRRLDDPARSRIGHRNGRLAGGPHHFHPDDAGPVDTTRQGSFVRFEAGLENQSDVPRRSHHRHQPVVDPQYRRVGRVHAAGHAGRNQPAHGFRTTRVAAPRRLGVEPWRWLARDRGAEARRRHIGSDARETPSDVDAQLDDGESRAGSSPDAAARVAGAEAWT